MLLEQALRLAASRRLHGGQEQGNQNADDGDDHQQLDKRKCRTFTPCWLPDGLCGPAWQADWPAWYLNMTYDTSKETDEKNETETTWPRTGLCLPLRTPITARHSDHTPNASRSL